MICIYEGDAGYSSGNAHTPGARHRLTIDMKSGAFEFEFENCNIVKSRVEKRRARANIEEYFFRVEK